MVAPLASALVTAKPAQASAAAGERPLAEACVGVHVVERQAVGDRDDGDANTFSELHQCACGRFRQANDPLAGGLVPRWLHHRWRRRRGPDNVSGLGHVDLVLDAVLAVTAGVGGSITSNLCLTAMVFGSILKRFERVAPLIGSTWSSTGHRSAGRWRHGSCRRAHRRRQRCSP